MNYYNRYPSDLRGKVMHLSAAQEGIYNRLLDWQYENERGLPKDPKQQQMLARCADAAERRICIDVVAEFFTLECDDGLWNSRTREEVDKANARISAARTNGAKGGRPPKFSKPKVPRGTKPGNNPLGYENMEIHKPTGLLEINQESNLTETQKKALHPPSLKEEAIPPSAGASPPPADPLFGYGLDLLKSKGVGDKAARSFIGLMRKECGEVTAFDLLQIVDRDDITDPVSWLSKAVTTRKKPSVNGSKVNSAGLISANPDKDYTAGVGPNGSF